MHRSRALPVFVGVSILLIMLCWNVFESQQMTVSAYSPSIGHTTTYDYGFISIQPNQTATNIQFWTELNLAPSNYTLHWHQHVNLTIRVTNIAQIASTIRAYYNFSVNIHSNIATVSNSSWQTVVTMNGSVAAPAPTGVTNGIVESPITDGLPGFFLDDLTLSTIIVGSNVNIGGSVWQTIEYSTFTLTSSEQLSYQLYNSSTTTATHLETMFLIDHDVGIYYRTNDTRLLLVGTIRQSLTYYYQVLSTNIALLPPPNPLPIYIIAAVAATILIIVVVLLIRNYWLRRR